MAAKQQQSAVKKVTRPGRWERVDGVLTWIEGAVAELCGLGCGGGHTVPRTATQFSCEHGTWDLVDPEQPAPAAPVPAEQQGGEGGEGGQGPEQPEAEQPKAK